MSVLVVTSLGDIVVDLHTDLCPLTCKNFLKLCKIKYYNGCLFHAVQKDFTAQTGDPTGTGTGGDSIYKFLYGGQARFFGDEIRMDLKHGKIGTVAMASAGENLNASQFYFTLRDDLDYLDGKHTVFGEVAEGLETLTRINESYADEKGRPFKNIRIKHTYILDDPFDDPPQLAELIPEASPEGKPKDEVDEEVRLEDDWVPLEEQVGTTELEEVLRTKEAHSRAVVLESIGDIPDAEIKPPENVLFVCKLNPVTEDEDLHTIFSRFGTVVSADIIRDYKTGDSLCYAFIEFETQEACEEAYFKMDNALIDDRRIHVDFSQSVAKLWSQYRRKDNQTGRGCFKCGALDHIAKDCTGSPIIKQQPPRYMLKDDNTQRGGDNNSRYEMVFFDGDTEGSPRQEKRRQDHELENRTEKQEMNRRGSEDLKHRDHERKDSSDRHRQSDRSRGYREDEENRESKPSRSSGSRRDQEYREVRMDRETHMERRRDKDNDKKDERDYRKRSADSDNHRDRRDGGDHRMRSADNDSRVDRRDDRDYRKRSADNDRRDKRDETNNSKRRADNDGHKGRGEERDYGRRSTEIDDKLDHDRDRSRDRREKRDETNNSKTRADNDGHKGRGEERNYGRRSTEIDDKLDHDRDRDRRHRGDKRR